MCCRYCAPNEDDTDFKLIFKEIEAVYQTSPALAAMKRGEICPADIAPVITGGPPALMKWGFARPDGKGLVINARLETAEARPMFREFFTGQRCLIPASRYFEWKKDGARKQKYAFYQPRSICMAGLYRPGESVPLFVVLTRPASPAISSIHDRMPVILPEDMYGRWLNGSAGAAEILDSSPGDMAYSEC